MNVRRLSPGVRLALVLTALLLSPSAAGAQARPGTPAAKKYVPPRTPWGDPDLQDNFTNLYELSTPFERPDEFAGRKPLLPYDCHEGNYALTNILSGARADERAVAEDAKRGIVRATRAIPTDEER